MKLAVALVACCLSASCAPKLPAALTESSTLALPQVGDHQLRVLSPTLLELSLIATKAPDPARITAWDFVGSNAPLAFPQPEQFEVDAGGARVAVTRVGFKRRPLYAPLKQRDLRVNCQLYLELESPLTNALRVVVRNPDGRLWPASMEFAATNSPTRESPAIHVNQTGYLPTESKSALVGYYLGSLGEMPAQRQTPFQLVDAASGATRFNGWLVPRPDHGYRMPAYQAVLEANFTAFQTPGSYRLQVPGLGLSLPFDIGEGAAAAFARAYALGIYHQRCGTALELPFTRFTHGPCHARPAEVPTAASKATQNSLKKMTAGYDRQTRHTAPQLKDTEASLYPYVNRSPRDVAGGHHDAGDYSKYTINSAAFIHHLVFAADNFPGVGELDNLGLPESGDGRSDVLQEVKWEADFLAKMQDDDGGFYFLVYPRDRAYENNVTPDRGDPQVVFPKTTAVTAAAVAALAQTASSPRFQKQFPEAARLYLDKARRGWAFLQAAIAKHGRDGAYQKITHYGDLFMHDDELAWAAAEIYLATGDEKAHADLRAHFDPASKDTRRWTWWRLSEAYGCAIRSYAFAASSSRRSTNQLDAAFLAACRTEVLAAADDQLRRANDCAYGTSFPEESKRIRAAGYFFPADVAFDLAVAYQVQLRADFLDALLSNLNYENGANPVNICFVTGLGWKRQREIVHQYAQNDRRVLPPSGIPLSALQAGFAYLDKYKRELGQLCFPLDGADDNPYAPYDRWGDSFNVNTEFVIVNQARGLATTAFLMARTSLKNQPWKPIAAEITGLPKKSVKSQAIKLSLRAAGLELANARIVWEAAGEEPFLGEVFAWTPRATGKQWVEAEAQLPDGRRVFAAAEIEVN